ncbi:hypothetical protein V3C99_014656 [Haemonchus contortus]
MRRHVILLSIFCAINIVSAQPITVQNDEVEESSLIVEDPQPLVESEDDVAPPELPHWTASEKALMIRRSGQDPTRRRRHSITRVQKLKRDLALAPWRVTHVVRRRPPPPKKTNRPAIALPVDVCPTKFDAITRGYNGRTYAFAKDRVYQMWYEDELPQKASYLITELFPDGPRTVSAALTNSRSGVTILIDHRTAYRFRWNRKHKRFQLARNTPQDLPQNITFTPQTAFEWMDGNQVLLSGENFVIYDAYWNLATFTGATKRYFPKLPRNLLGIIYTGGNTMLMYTKQNTIKVYNARKYRILQEYPLKINEYFGCLL